MNPVADTHPVDRGDPRRRRSLGAGSAAPPLEPFDLDHNDDRSGWIGVSHQRCNRGAPHRKRPPTPTSDTVTVSTLIAALADDVDPDTPVVVRIVGTEQLLWISEITLNAMQERYSVDEAVIALPAEYVILAVAQARWRDG